MCYDGGIPTEMFLSASPTMEYNAFTFHQRSNRNGFVKISPLQKNLTDNAPLYHSLIGLRLYSGSPNIFVGKIISSD